MRRLALLALGPFLLSAADPVAVARAEAAAAQREVRRLEKLAASARSEAERLVAELAVATEAIVEAEAALVAAEARLHALARKAEIRERRLAEGQRPAALLLAGLAEMGRRPPILSLADGASPREFVIMRALLDSGLPVIRKRTAALREQVEQGGQLSAAAAGARQELARRRRQLGERQTRFAALEARANARSAELGGHALAASDVAIGRTVMAEELTTRSARQRNAVRLAAALAALPEAPARPTTGDGAPVRPVLDWQLPVTGPVSTGLFEVSQSGVRARGLTVDARRGAEVVAPAPGRIAFAGPFRRYAGVVIIDHGKGWMTLMTQVWSDLAPRARVARGERIGRTLGSPTIELSLHGKPQDAALIAGSSASLSNGGHNR
jgi:septal ring factor EnvC (AmiA/AmiB activator)